LKEMQGSELDGRQLRLDYVGSKSQGKTPQRGGGTPGGNRSFNNSGESEPSKSLVVKNLSYDTTNDSLQEAFENSVGARVLMCPEDPSRSRGMGFVDFDSVEEAQQAMKSMQGGTVDGRQVKLDFATPRGGGVVEVVVVDLIEEDEVEVVSEEVVVDVAVEEVTSEGVVAVEEVTSEGVVEEEVAEVDSTVKHVPKTQELSKTLPAKRNRSMTTAINIKRLCDRLVNIDC